MIPVKALAVKALKANLSVLTYILPIVVGGFQVYLMSNAKLDAKIRPYVIQIRDLCLMLVPLEVKAFNKKTAMKKVG